MEKLCPAAAQILNERFGHDVLLSLATVEDGVPYVRTVDSYYEDGCFYTITHARSNKIRQIAKKPTVAICGDWFTAHGIGENRGYILSEANREQTAKLRQIFSEWYDNGDIDEADPDTCLLCIPDGLLLSHGTAYDIDFT